MKPIRIKDDPLRIDSEAFLEELRNRETVSSIKNEKKRISKTIKTLQSQNIEELAKKLGCQSGEGIGKEDFDLFTSPGETILAYNFRIDKPSRKKKGTK